MKCNNCGMEFEGTVCPECGNCPQAESSEEKISENEFSESPKKSENEIPESPKKSGKPQSEFAKSVKANKKIFIIVAVFLILLIVLGSSLTAVLTDDFRIGNMEKITIGMPKDYVRINLGEPHETEENETLWKYYSLNYKKFLERSKDDADFSEKKAAFVHNEIRITFSDDKVYAVEMLKDFSENTKDAKKEIKKVQISRNSIRRYTYFEGEFYAVIQYKDGSFKNAPVTLTKQPNTVNLGINRVSWYDEWSRSEITQEITVVPNPDIYLRGRLPGTKVRYLVYEIKGGYALEIFGSGTIATTAVEYPWDEIKNKLLYLKVSEGITQIENNAFYNYDALLSAELPESLTNIGANAFYNCNKLKNINIRDSVTSIGSSAFWGCSSLVSIEIPSSVKRIGRDAFWGCSSLTKVEISDIAAWCGIEFSNYDANPLSSAKHLYLNGEEVTELVIPERVTSIGSYAFYNCNSLLSVAIPDSVTSIGKLVFNGCSSLVRIEIPTSVTSIGEDAFRNCYSLTIYAEASAKPSGWNSDWNYRNCPVVWDYKNNDVADDRFIYTVQNGIRYGIKDGAATVVRQPRNITTANIPSEIAYKDNAYRVMSIGDSAFEDCHSLVSVEIPTSVTSIGSYAFWDCRSLMKVEISNIAAWCKIEFVGKFANPLEFANYLYINGEEVTELVIPEGVTSIGTSAFYGCSSLISIVIPTSVTSIGSDAFNNCRSLVSVIIPSGVTRIDGNAFSNCNSLETIAVAKGNTKYHSIGNCLIETETKKLILGCKNSIIPTDGSVTSIGNHAFDGCTDLGSVEIPSSVTSIGDYAFSGCRRLESVVIPEGVTSIGDYVFLTCDRLVSVVIPSSVTSIGYGAFYNCSSLESVVIPNSVTSIGNEAFRETGIWNNAANNSVVYVDKWAVGYKGEKDAVTNIVLRADTVGIGSEAFRYCSSLESIEYDGTKEKWIAIKKGDDWNYNTGNYTVTCSNGTLTKIESQA